jgi:hypothetical protein
MFRFLRLALVSAVALGFPSCGSDSPTTPDPLSVKLGDTMVILMVNPPVNDLDTAPGGNPGDQQGGVAVTLDGVAAGATDADGRLVLGPLTPGAHVIGLSGGEGSGEIPVTLADGDLLEVAASLDGTGAAVMQELRYPFQGTVYEFTPADDPSVINEALAQSDAIILLGGGTYAMDLAFTGSDVTLFGAGVEGGMVTVTGNVTVEGSHNRIRGIDLLGELSMPGSTCSLVFSRSLGSCSVVGSAPILIQNRICGSLSVSGSNAVAFGNWGTAPLAPRDCS